MVSLCSCPSPRQLIDRVLVLIISTRRALQTCTALLAKVRRKPRLLLPASLAQLRTGSSTAKPPASSRPASLPTLYPAPKLKALRKTTTPAETIHVMSVGLTSCSSSAELARRAFFATRRSRDSGRLRRLIEDASCSALGWWQADADVLVLERRMVGLNVGSWNCGGEAAPPSAPCCMRDSGISRKDIGSTLLPRWGCCCCAPGRCF